MTVATRDKIYVGIDPGQTGAFAVIYPGGSVESCHAPFKIVRKKLPRSKTKAGKPRFKTVAANYDFRRMYLLFYRLRLLQRDRGCEVIVGIERQCARPTDAKGVVFAVGRNQMVWEAMAGANKFLPKMVSPSVWKPLYLGKGASKERSRQLCLQLYPTVSLPLKKDEARAEAILIADYLLRLDRVLTFPRQSSLRGGASR